MKVIDRINIAALTVCFAWFACMATGLADEERHARIAERYEEILLESPRAGSSFERVYTFHLENGTLEELEQRWRARMDDDAVHAFLVALLAEHRGEQAEALDLLRAAVELDPDFHEAWKELARLAERAKDDDVTSRALRSAVASAEHVEDRHQARRALAAWHLRHQQTAAAAEVWEEALAQSPDDPLVAIEAADLFAEAGLFERAVELLESMPSRVPDPFERMRIELQIGLIEERMREPDRALARYQRLLDETTERSWMRRELRLRIEALFRSREDLVGLAAHYRERLASHPGDLDAALRLARVIGELGHHADAVAVLRDATRSHPDNPGLQWELSRRLLAAGEADDAITVLEELLRRDPEAVEVHEAIGEIHWTRHRESGDAAHRAAAIAAWRGIAPEGAPLSRVHRLATLLQNAGLDEEAETELRRCLVMDPRAPDLREALGTLLLRAGRPEEAWEILSVLGGPEAPAGNFIRLARIQQRAELPEDALRTVAEGLEQHADHPDLLELQFQLFSATGNVEEALRVCSVLRGMAASPERREQFEKHEAALLAQSGRARVFIAEVADTANDPDSPAPDEETFRLGAHTALAAADPAAADNLLGKALAAHPDSISLLALRAEVLRQTKNEEDLLPLLERLIETDVPRRAVWMREHTESLRRQGDTEGTITSVRSLAAAFPGDPAELLYAAGVAEALHSPQDAERWLREAALRSENPREPLIRLGLLLSASQRDDEAIEALWEAFEKEPDTEGRLAATIPLTEAYIQAGRSGELVRRFRQLQQAEAAEGSHYALFLAEILERTGDFAGAHIELNKALAVNPDDLNLVRRLLEITRREGNAAGQVRYLRLLAEADPTAENELALARGLAEEGNSVEALAILERHVEALAENPNTLRELILLIDESVPLEDLDNFLDQVAAFTPDNPEWPLHTIMFLAAANRHKEAASRAWEIYQSLWNETGGLFDPRQRRSIMFSGPFQMLALPPRPTPGQMEGNLLLRRLGHIIQQAQTFRHSLRQATRPGRAPFSGNLQPDAADVRDFALSWVAWLAHESPDDALPEWLEEQVLALHEDPADRMVALAAIGSQDALAGEVEKAALEFDVDRSELALFLLIADAVRVSDNEATLRALLAGFEDNLYDHTRMTIPMVEAFRRTGQPDKASALIRMRVETMDFPHFSESHFLLPLILEEENPAALTLLVERFNASMDDPSRHPGHFRGAMQPLGLLNRALLLRRQTRYPPPRPIHHLEDSAEMLLRLHHRIMVEAGHQEQAMAAQFRQFHRPEPILFPSKFVDLQSLHLLPSTMEALRAEIGVEKLDAMLAAHARELQGEARDSARFLHGFNQWQRGEQDAALRIFNELAAADPQDHGLQLTLACMLAEHGNATEARAILESIPSDAGAYHEAAQFELLFTAQAAGDLDAARDAARRADGLQLPHRERQRLDEALTALGLRPAPPAIPPTPPRVSPAQARHQLVMEIRSAAERQDRKEVLRIAPRVLSGDLLSDFRTDSMNPARETCQALFRVGRLAHQVRQWERQLAENPDSQRLHFLLANAYPIIRETRGDSRDFMGIGGDLWLRLVRRGNEFSAYFSRDGRRWAATGPRRAPLAERVYVGLALSGGGGENYASAVFSDVAIRGHEEADAPDWTATDIGRAPAPGVLERDGESFMLSSRGREIWDLRDSFLFVHRMLEGDGEITARVQWIEADAEWTKAGIMMRSGLDPHSPFVMMATTPELHASLQWRLRADPSLWHWQRLAELRGGSPPFRLALADQHAERWEYDEALALYAELFATHPMETLRSGRTIAAAYAEAERLGELRDILSGLRVPSDSQDVNNLARFYQYVANHHARAGELKTTDALHSQALALPAEGMRASLQQNHIRFLAEHGMRDRLREELLALFFDEESTGAPAAAHPVSLLRATIQPIYQQHHHSRILSSVAHHGTRPVPTAKRLIRIAKEHDLTGVLAEGARARLAQESGPPRGMDWVFAALLAAHRDADALNLIAAIAEDQELAAAIPDFAARSALTLFLIQCLEWPEARPFAVRAMRNLVTKDVPPRLSAHFGMLYAAWLAATEDLEGNAEEFARALDLLEALVLAAVNQSGPGRVDGGAALYLLWSLLDRGEYERTATLLDTVSPHLPQRSHETEVERIRAWLRASEKGEELAPSAWPDTSLPGAVAWSLVPEAWLAEEAPPARGMRPPDVSLDGWKIRIISGMDFKEKVVAEFAAAAEGVWEGRDETAGVVSLELVCPDGRKTRSRTVRRVWTASRIPNPSFAGAAEAQDVNGFSIEGWTIENMERWREATLPTGAGHNVSARAGLSATITSDPIPIAADRDHHAALWVRVPTTGVQSFTLAFEFLNEQGDQIGTASRRISAIGWHRIEAELTPTGVDGSIRIPSNTDAVIMKLTFNTNAVISDPWFGAYEPGETSGD